MKQWETLTSKPARLGIGLMSGTSADGVDAAWVRVEGCGTATRVKQLGFAFLPFAPEVRARILQVASGEFGGAAELCRLNFRLGALLADACEEVCRQAGISPEQIDFVGSHGQTVWHIPDPEEYLGHLRQALPGCAVLTNEDLGLNSDSKEAVAFAILANETLFGVCNNAPGATGARHPVVMGKISL